MVATQGVTTTVYIGNYYEWHGTPADMVKYYYSGATRVAMRVGANAPVFLMGDHLGSTSVAVNEQGAPVGGSPQLYKAWGETRAGSVPTKYQYTGQFKDSYIKLYWYGSRWYDPELSRWNQPDSIIPTASQGVQAWDRYAYVNNSPVNYVDPTGHMLDDGCRTEGCDTEREKENYKSNPVIEKLKAEHERKKGTSSQPGSSYRPSSTPTPPGYKPTSGLTPSLQPIPTAPGTRPPIKTYYTYNALKGVWTFIVINANSSYELMINPLINSKSLIPGPPTGLEGYPGDPLGGYGNMPIGPLPVTPNEILVPYATLRDLYNLSVKAWESNFYENWSGYSPSDGFDFGTWGKLYQMEKLLYQGR